MNRKNFLRKTVFALDLSKFSKDSSIAGEMNLIIEIRLVDAFIRQYFERNPNSSIALVAMINSTAKLLHSFTSNPEDLIKSIHKISKTGGYPSLYNCLRLGYELLEPVEDYFFKEITILLFSNTTKDPALLSTTRTKGTLPNLLIEHGITVNFVGINSKIEILETLSRETNGLYFVVKSESNFQDSLSRLVESRSFPLRKGERIRMIPVGFPRALNNDVFSVNISSVHYELNEDFEEVVSLKMRDRNFECPKCSSLIWNIPGQCQTCGLFLLSLAHYSRLTQKISPVKPFEEVEHRDGQRCGGCGSLIKRREQAYRCVQCQTTYCKACNKLIHQSLQNCPGCLLSSSVRKDKQN